MSLYDEWKKEKEKSLYEQWKEEKKKNSSSSKNNEIRTNTNSDIVQKNNNSNLTKMIAKSGHKITDNTTLDTLPMANRLNSNSLNLDITEQDVEKNNNILQRYSDTSNNSKAVGKNILLGAKNTVLQIPYIIDVNTEINNPYYKQSLNRLYLNSDKVSDEDKLNFINSSRRCNERYRRKYCYT